MISFLAIFKEQKRDDEDAGTVKFTFDSRQGDVINKIPARALLKITIEKIKDFNVAETPEGEEDDGISDGQD